MIGYWDDTGLYIHKSNWTPELAARFEMKNLAKEEAKRMQRWNWHKLPDVLKCYTMGNNAVKIPLGILGVAPHLFENRRTAIATHEFPPLAYTPYEHQQEGVDSLLKNTIGVLHASTGAGKTIMACMIAKQTGLKTLIVVKDKTLMMQMVNDILTQFNFIVPYYGGTQKKSYVPNTDLIHVCLVDSRHKIENLESFGCIILDECHALLQSDARREWVGTLNPHRLYGMSGTINLNKVDDEAFRIFLGPTTRVAINNFTPQYLQVYTDYIGYLDDPDQFALFENEIYEDVDRNALIVKVIKKTIGNRKGLVFVKRVEHAYTLAKMIQESGIESRVLIGEVKQDDREKIKKEVMDMKGPVVIVGNTAIIGTGFNLPELSIAYLTVAERFRSSIQQYIGRIVRKHPNKTDCIFVDFVDISTGVLYNQSRERLRAFKEYYPDGKPKLLGITNNS